MKYLGSSYSLIHQENNHFLFLTENNSGIGASGYGVSGPTWDRGANLKDYYARKEEQEVQAVRLSPCVTSPRMCDEDLVYSEV